MAEVPAFKYPLQVVNGSFVALEQDEPVEVAQTIGLLLSTPAGWRELEPDVGITDPTGLSQPDLGEIERQLATHEPRAESAVEQDPQAIYDTFASFGINVTAEIRED